MKIDKIVVQACCGRKHFVFKLDRPVDKLLLAFLAQNQFNEATHFTKAGMLYLDNSNLTITAPLGADRLNVNCKKKDCDQILNDFEALLNNYN